MRRIVLALLFGASSLAVATTATAQVTPPRPTRRDTTGVAPDSAQRDTALVRWAREDSVMRALLGRAGYEITRYQGRRAIFDAQTRALDLQADSGGQAAVERGVGRGGQVAVSDSGIFYADLSGVISVGGNYVLRDPATGQADIKGFGLVQYDLRRRSAYITNARFPYTEGENTWQLTLARAHIQGDSARGGVTLLGKGATLTSCEDSVPHYHFQIKEAKQTPNRTVFGRSAILYLRDVPVMWLPFMFQQIRTGRRSGILTPRFGISDIVRNSPSYRRNIENLGYYMALNEYMDVAAWIDWRSGGTGGSVGDPGWLRYTGEWQYEWLDRFLGGRVAAAYTQQGTGQTNLALSLNHRQSFSNEGRLNISANYTKNTTIQRQNSFDPIAALATIQSSAQYSRRFGPATASIGGTRTQYPGRERLDQAFPTLSITSAPVKIGDWLSFTPGLNYSTQQSLKIDQPGPFQYRYVTSGAGVRDSVQLRKNSYSSSLAVNLPIQLLGQELGQAFTIRSQRNEFPEQFTIFDVRTGDSVGTRIFAETYRTDMDWTPTFQLPPLARNVFNLSPSVTLQNVDPGPFWVKTERTNGRFVAQSKRLSFGVSASPSIFGLFPGFGPFSAIRHSVSPTIGYSYAPKAEVSDEYLAATGRFRRGYLGALRQNVLSFGLSQLVEAKVPVPGDSTGERSEKLRLLSLQVTPLTYDFERLRAPEVTGTEWWRGLTTERFGYTLRSDLLPGIDLSVNYSLFQGSTTSDTAVFKPHRETVAATLNLSRRSNPFVVLARLFGKAVPEAQHAPVASRTPGVNPDEQAQAREAAAQPVAGSGARGTRFIVPPSDGWRAAFTFSSSSPRQPVGSNVIDYDPRARCEDLAGGNPFLLDACLAQQRNQPTIDTPIPSTTAGGPIYRLPPTTNIGADFGFNLTPKWTAAWRTNYDAVRHEFASHTVTLQRDLHDWRAMFNFTQSPNGNFAFSFSVYLKAQSDLKFDYNRATVRSGQSF